MLNAFTKFCKIGIKQHQIMLDTFSLSMIIWKTAIETWDQKMNGGPGMNWGAQRDEQFIHLGNDTLTPA